MAARMRTSLWAVAAPLQNSCPATTPLAPAPRLGPAESCGHPFKPKTADLLRHEQATALPSIKHADENDKDWPR